MDYKLHVEQYRNGNSCCTLFNDLKISEKKNKMGKTTFVIYDTWNDYNINIRVLTQMFNKYKHIYILHDKYILVSYNILFTIIYQFYPLSLSFLPNSYLFILIQT